MHLRLSIPAMRVQLASLCLPLTVFLLLLQTLRGSGPASRNDIVMAFNVKMPQCCSSKCMLLVTTRSCSTNLTTKSPFEQKRITTLRPFWNALVFSAEHVPFTEGMMKVICTRPCVPSKYQHPSILWYGALCHANAKNMKYSIGNGGGDAGRRDLWMVHGHGEGVPTYRYTKEPLVEIDMHWYWLRETICRRKDKIRVCILIMQFILAPAAFMLTTRRLLARAGSSN